MSLIIKQYLLVIIIAQFAIFWAKVNKKNWQSKLFQAFKEKIIQFLLKCIIIHIKIMMLSNKIVLLHFKFSVYD